MSFFGANQQKGNMKLFSLTQYDFSVNRCDWRILVGKDDSIIRILKQFIKKYRVNTPFWRVSSRLYIPLKLAENLGQCYSLSRTNQG